MPTEDPSTWLDDYTGADTNSPQGTDTIGASGTVTCLSAWIRRLKGGIRANSLQKGISFDKTTPTLSSTLVLNFAGIELEDNYLGISDTLYILDGDGTTEYFGVVKTILDDGSGGINVTLGYLYDAAGTTNSGSWMTSDPTAVRVSQFRTARSFQVNPSDGHPIPPQLSSIPLDTEMTFSVWRRRQNGTNETFYIPGTQPDTDYRVFIQRINYTEGPYNLSTVPQGDEVVAVTKYTDKIEVTFQGPLPNMGSGGVVGDENNGAVYRVTLVRD